MSETPAQGVKAPVSPKLRDLKSKLREIFQLDQKELDFGIYRILNQKAEEIERFLDDDLLPQVQQVLAATNQSGNADIQADLTKLEASLRDAGMNPDESPKVQELRTRLSEGGDMVALEDEVYSHLYNFFRRYYSEGDFISQRRYKEGVYAIPYEGEEVKLHWANHDQYYIKSTESLSSYAFKTGDGKRIRFELVSATTEQDNKKEQKGSERRFVLADPALRLDGEDLILNFSYARLDKKTKQSNVNKETVISLRANTELGTWAAPLFATAPTDNNPDRTAIEKHLDIFTKKNSFDYFIHKDLGKFLGRELDFYVKNEVMFLDDIENETAPKVETYLNKIKAIRIIAKKLIRMLAQLEDFQKELWLKKKFVLETNYCITLDRVPEALYEEIAANDAQREEWVRLFAIDEIRGNRAGGVNYSVPLTTPFLSANKFLTVDTAFYEGSFVDELLARINEFDEQCDGLLVHGENFQGLQLLQEQYQDQVQCIYIDPPYNTGNDGFAYKDQYQHSSWISMLSDRLDLSRRFLSEKGVCFSSINEVERFGLEAIFNNVFGPDNRVEELIWAQDTARNNSPTYSRSHEYLEVYAKKKSLVESERDMFREPKPGYREVADFLESINPDYPPLAFIEGQLSDLMSAHKMEFENEIRERGGDVKEERKNDPWKGIYPYRYAEYRTNAGDFISEANAAEAQAQIWVWREVDPSMPSGKQSETTKDSTSDNFRYYKPKHPKSGVPCVHPKRGWAFPEQTQGERPSLEKYILDHRIVFKDDENKPPQMKYFLHEVSTNVSKSVVRQYADGEQELFALFGDGELFTNPKPTGLIRRLVQQTCFQGDTIIDFFGGSGTTGHALINADRESELSRKYIMIEMGDHFDSVLKPRIQKVTYSIDWKDGKPISREGSSHCFKYIRLESYEDSLNNLISRRDDAASDLLANNDAAREDYMLGYMMDFETRGSPSLLNVEMFDDPFNYKLRITRNDEAQDVRVDLAETFNFLIGLKVSARARIRGVLAIEGITRTGEKTLILWRNVTEVDRETLNDWFKRQDYSTRDTEFDVIYVNGDNNLENLRRDDETWKVRLTEQEFKARMFDVDDV